MKRALFRVLAGGHDITALIADRLISLSVSDSAGTQSDTLTIQVDNRDDIISIPSTGKDLHVFMGLEGDLVDKGVFVIDELEEGLDDQILQIHGKAADMKGSIKAPASRTWDDQSVGSLCDAIAARHGYLSAVHPEARPVPLGHLNQHAESDLALLTRICKDRGLVFKVAAQRLLITPKDAPENAEGVTLPTVVIADPADSSGRVTIAERNDYRAVKVCYFDEAQQVNVEVVLGDAAGPVYDMKSKAKNREDAAKQANAKLSALLRGKSTMMLTRPLTADIVAQGLVDVVGHRQTANGLWQVESVEHAIGPGQVGSSTMQLTTAIKSKSEIKITERRGAVINQLILCGRSGMIKSVA